MSEIPDDVTISEIEIDEFFAWLAEMRAFTVPASAGAPAPSFAALTDDYEFAVGLAGSLGGVEL